MILITLRDRLRLMGIAVNIVQSALLRVTARTSRFDAASDKDVYRTDLKRWRTKTKLRSVCRGAGWSGVK
jgi:hypothetical protein